MSDVQQQAAPQSPVISTETPVAVVSAPQAVETAPVVAPADQSAPQAVVIPPANHAAAQDIFSSLLTKLENFEHALAADAKAELLAIAKLLHL